MIDGKTAVFPFTLVRKISVVPYRLPVNVQKKYIKTVQISLVNLKYR